MSVLNQKLAALVEELVAQVFVALRQAPLFELRSTGSERAAPSVDRARAPKKKSNRGLEEPEAPAPEGVYVTDPAMLLAAVNEPSPPREPRPVRAREARRERTRTLEPVERQPKLVASEPPPPPPRPARPSGHFADVDGRVIRRKRPGAAPPVERAADSSAPAQLSLPTETHDATDAGDATETSQLSLLIESSEPTEVREAPAESGPIEASPS